MSQDEQRPDRVFDAGLQQERGALAWERTAIAIVVAGVLFLRKAMDHDRRAFAAVGILTVVAGAAMLVWAGWRYDELHAPLRREVNPAHPTAIKVVGIGTVVFVGAALVLSVVGIVGDVPVAP